MLAAGDSAETILEGYPWLDLEDIKACLVYARRLVGMNGWNRSFWKQERESPFGYLRVGWCPKGSSIRWTRCSLAGNWEQDPGDEEILAKAHDEGRVLVTLDKDFGELAVVKRVPHSGF